jgi:hypothetical protein
LGGHCGHCHNFRRRLIACSVSGFCHQGTTNEVIALAVRWYVRYGLTDADVA